MIDVSFIIVSWNAKDFLLKCVESISKEVGACTYEIVVVDNNSTDGSPEALEREYPEARLIQTGANLGFAKGNNIGIKESTGRFLCLINSDALLLPGCVDTLHQYMCENPAVGMCGPRVHYPDGSLQPSCRRFPTLFRSLCSALGLSALNPKSSLVGDTFMTWWNHDDNRTVDVMSGCFMFVRREAIDQVGLLDEDFFMYGEDIDWCRRFNIADWKIAFNSAAQAIHHGGASSSNYPVPMYVAMQESRFKYWKKHHGSVSRLAMGSIMFLQHALRFVARAALYVAVPAKRSANAFKVRMHWAVLVWLLTGTADGQERSIASLSPQGLESRRER